MIQKNKSNAARRAWKLLRLVRLQTRKGGVYRCKFMIDLHLFPKFLKSILGHSNHRGAIPYGERELSFEKTPIVHIKMHRPSSMRFKMPNIPCLNPQADLEYDYAYEYGNENDAISYCNEEETRKSFLLNDLEDMVECEIGDDDEGIDRKADEFIANFYKQMKMQRQVSYLQYNEMLNRGTD